MDAVTVGTLSFSSSLAVTAGALLGEFGFKGPPAVAGGGAEEAEERLADGGFAGDVVQVELDEGCVVELDEPVSWLEAGLLAAQHGGILQEGERECQRNDRGAGLGGRNSIQPRMERAGARPRPR